MFTRTNWRSRLAMLGTIAALVGAGACSSDNNNGGTTGGSISLALNPTSATVVAGGSTTATGTLTRSGGYTGDVTVTGNTTATGISASVPSQPDGNNSATVTITASATATPGVDTITVIASGNGVTQATATFLLTVMSATTQAIALGVTPAAVTLQAGSSTTVTGFLTRAGGYTGNVTVSGTTAANGLTASIATQPNAGDSVQITLATSTSATPGVDTVTISAGGTGVQSATALVIVTVVAANGQSIGFTAATGSLALGLSGTAMDSLTVTRTGYTGNVTFTAENLPTGLTATFVQPNAGTTGVVSFAAAATATPGTYTVLLRGAGTGVSDVTVPVIVVINGTGTGGSFTLSSSATSLNVSPSDTVTANLTITRGTGYTGAITFTDTLTGISSSGGLTATIAPNPIPTGSSTATLSVVASASVPLGTYTLTLKGSGAGIVNGDQTLVIRVTVTALSGSSVHLDYSGCTTGTKPVFVAYQDGSGAWTVATGTNDVYNFSITSAKGGLAVVTPNASGTGHTTTVRYLSQSEFNTFTGSCGATASGKTLTGTYAGVATGDQVNVAMGGATTTSVATSATGAYTLTNVATGMQDLLGYDHSAANPGTADKLIIRRDQNFTSGAVIPVLDFSAAEAVAPATANISITGSNSGDVLTETTSYLTGTSCSVASLTGGTVNSGQTNFTAYGVPSASQRTTDFSQVGVYDANGTSTRGTTVSFHTLADRSVALPAALTGASVTTLSGGAYKRLQATVTLPSDYSSATFTYSDAVGNTVVIIQSAAYLAGSSATLSAPDLSALAGFSSSWEPATGASLTYAVSASSNAAPSICTEGASLKFASVTGTA